MKIKSPIKIVILAAALIAPGSRSQVITSFVPPMPAWRSINGQVFNLISLPTVKIPPDLSYQVIGYNGVPGQRVRLQGSAQAMPAQSMPPAISVTFENFAFDPKDFSPVYGANGLQPAHALYCRALKTDDVTNLNVLGQAVSVDIVYDCGTSVTNALLVMP
jgi:hypothetical protein